MTIISLTLPQSALSNGFSQTNADSCNLRRHYGMDLLIGSSIKEKLALHTPFLDWSDLEMQLFSQV